MARRSLLMESKMIDEINLTPLMDLTFILLITFIITFPLLENSLPVNLPSAEGTPPEEEETVTLTVDEAGTWFFEQREVTRDQLKAELRFLQESRPEVTLLLRGDQELRYGDLMEVMALVREQGFRKLSLVTQSGGSGG